MTRFLDGPAQDVTLLLQRAPKYLRAVQDREGTWDALDQLTDSPQPDERVIVYEMVSGPMRIHLQRRERGRRVCGWYEGGEYRIVADQPGDVVRSTTGWRAWVTARVGQPLADDGTAASETVQP